VTVEVFGEARGNPGFAGIGAVVRDRTSHTTERVSRYLGLATPAQAEYQAVIHGLEAAMRQSPDRIILRLAHETTWRQLTGKSGAHTPEVAELYVRAHELMARALGLEIELAGEQELELAERLAAVAIETRGRRTAID